MTSETLIDHTVHPEASEGARLLKCGEIAESEKVVRLGIAPAPVCTGRKPLCISTFLSKKTRYFIEFSMTNNNVHVVQIYVFTRVMILSMFLYGLLTFGFDVLPATLPLFIGFSLWVWLEQKDMARDASTKLPLRFHAQRQAMLLSRTLSNRPIPKRPSPIGTDKSMFMLVLAYLLLGSSGTLLLGFLDGQFLFMTFENGTSFDENRTFFVILTIEFMVGLIPAYLLIKPWRQYFADKKGVVVSEELLSVPWESVAVEYQSTSLISLTTATNMQFLSFSVPDPKDANNSIAAISLPVHSKEEAFSLYEFIRQYMDEYKDNDGKDSAALADIAVAEPEYNRAGYKRFLQRRWEKNPVSYGLWRVWYWISLRYLSHFMMEYHQDVMPIKVQARADVIAWSSELPKDEWQTSSDALKALNQEVEALYALGHQWESEPVQTLLAKHRQSE
ncbi:hypothetical protein J8L86_20825 [Shewanella sp. MMG014]|uniref:hypothetical protein n=1 Tax=Shewanella sp. MMG014 TaxID=2822691 RepID=UPI001B392DF3|nr:hypothetical protein [Shewanella sp. MMG014]MBQ4892298.1 hypothetical protein [Shewanella sp. MMG014]